MNHIIKECPSCHSLFWDSGNRYDRCKFCNADYAAQKDMERQRIEDAKWLEKKKEEKAAFEKEIGSWNVVELNSILSDVGTPLYIIGNGFDLLHGAKSSYQDFNNALGKYSKLREHLETYLNTESLWTDFEEALGHLNVEMMTNHGVIDTFLGDYNAYDENASAADFYAAAEMAADPAVVIVDKLTKRFRKWIESITIPTLDRPLSSLITDAPVLCFNYTEFIEDFYGIDHDKVCYIHGCRKKIKGNPEDKLILGHMPGASDAEYEFDEQWNPKNSYRGQLIECAREVALQQISYCDDELTKHCDEIIKNHRGFFDGLKDITDVIVIGHSLAEVDWDYFNEINKDGLRWYISCYGIRSLESIKKFAERFSIDADRIQLFRLDGIKVNKNIAKDERRVRAPAERNLCNSNRWSVRELKGRLNIYEGETKCYSLIFPGFIRKAILFDTYLMAIGEETYLLAYESGNWKFVGELKSPSSQGIINAGLDRILYRDNELIFVYNNRIRRYSLKDGRLIENKALRYARKLEISGKCLKIR